MNKISNLRYHDVKQKIIDEIREYAPDTRLLSRPEMAKKFNVNRTTVDRAISELIGEGYLYSRDKSGTYVTRREVEESFDQIKGISAWGVILPNIMHDTYPGTLRGIEDVAHRSDINVIICNTDNNTEKQENYIDKLIEIGVMGIIIIPALIGETSLAPFRKLEQNSIPFIFCNRGVSGIEAPLVSSNNFYGGYIATKHLIECGNQVIAYLSHPFYSVSAERYQGYMGALAEADIEFDERYVKFGKSFQEENLGYENTMQLLHNNPMPDAIFCFGDILASGAYKAIEEAGLYVGRDISVVGYNNTSLCESLPVKLSSVKYKTYEIGTQAAELLNKINRGEDVPKNKTIILKPELIIRDSSGYFKK